MIKRIEDFLLRFIQKKCQHPDKMVASDILEGCANGIGVKYCRRCGAIKIDWRAETNFDIKYAKLEHCWRTPDPYLWKG